MSAADLSEEMGSVEHTLTGFLHTELHHMLGLNSVGHEPFGCECGNHSMTEQTQPGLW